MSEAADTGRNDIPLRFVSAGVEDALERFSEPELLAAGKVNVISVEAIQSRIGARWGLRRQHVFDFTSRVLERGVGTQGFFLRVSETDFFIVHPDLGRVAGQAACLRYLREVLNHFLGEDQMAALGVLQVVDIARGQVNAQRMDNRALIHVDTGVTEVADEEPQRAGGPETQQTLDRWTPFIANDGRQLRVSSTLEPVYELKGFTRIGFRMIRRVSVVQTNEELSSAQLALLSTADLLRVDLATVARGIVRLASEKEQQLSLIVPLSFISLSSARGRTECARQLKTAQSVVKLGVICEIRDIEGVPPGVLLTVTSLVRPFALLVVGHLINTTPGAIMRLDGAGLQALSFDCPSGLGDAEFMGWATAATRAARKVAKSVLVYGASSTRRAGALAALGASHVSQATIETAAQSLT